MLKRHSGWPVFASYALMKQRSASYVAQLARPEITFPSATMGPDELELPSWMSVSHTGSPVRASSATMRASVVAWMILSP
ncbi:hypothetical protein D3C83_157730 [compost metagenome]